MAWALNDSKLRGGGGNRLFGSSFVKVGKGRNKRWGGEWSVMVVKGGKTWGYTKNGRKPAWPMKRRRDTPEDKE